MTLRFCRNPIARSNHMLRISDFDNKASVFTLNRS
ncbi:Uncharacterised protein [Vibrio cholerae]|nr:Uncharacterised protein [Vibrio cholerae]